ncbi:terminase large subunit domain-containing protein [Streptomyces sp. sk226]|uniref:terminase large subunit domain-containing protein n=1 Tax=Streptomyces sp. sk226 TaxID=2034268 RepID=UPI000D1C89A4|nr:terminase family protein [Streptomyces sp. sk226]
MTTAIERQVAVYQTLPVEQRAEIVRLADKETRAVLAWAEQQMAIERSPGAMAAALTGGREWQARHLDLIDKAFVRIAAGERMRVLLNMPPRHGKQVADSEPVLTTRGWKRHGDLQVGDYVYAPSGDPVPVQWVSEPSNEKMRVTFSDGQSVLVHPNHEWSVYDRSRGEWRIVETRYLTTQTLHSGPKGRRGGRYRFQLPPVGPLQNPEADLPMDPYTLGVWLGDGTTGKASFCGTEEDVNRITGRIPYTLGARWVHPDTGVHYQYIKGLMAPLRAAGVLNRKHIPQGYLVASERQRRDLLAGLVDTDGSLGRDGRIRFVSASEELASDVRDLARTLGYRANLGWRPPDTRERSIWGGHPLKGGACWVTDWTPHDGLPQGTLSRKAIKHPVKTKRRVGFATVEPAAPEPGRCIQVEGSLYLVGRGLIPTHNSARAARWGPLWYLARNPEHRVMIASYAAKLAEGHGRWIRDSIRAHGDAIGINLRYGSQAANRFDLDGTEGGLVTAGVGGSLTGMGANIAIVDDPLKDAKDADSPVKLATLWDWWQQVINTRMEPNGSIIVIQTRWSENDLAGRILQSGAEDWTVINLPAIAMTADDPLGRNVGDPLWPERFQRKHLDRFKSAVGERGWWALYQQEPRPLEGGVWKWPWITENRITAQAFRGVDLTRTLVAIDTAGGREDSDEVGLIGGGRDNAGEMYLLADKSKKMGAAEWGREAGLLAIELQADAFVVEANFGGDMAAQIIRQAWAELERERLTGGMLMPRIIEVTAKVGKRLRAEPVAQLYENGHVHHVGEFPGLEVQYVSWIPGMDSPDRMDAAVHLLTELADPATASAGSSAYSDQRLAGRR